MWKCLSSPYFLNGPGVAARSWSEVGLKLRFNQRVESMADSILDKLIGPASTVDDATSLPTSRTSLHQGKKRRRHPEFIIIHLRRGDIITKCKPGMAEEECLVQIEEIAEKVDEIERQRRIQALAAVTLDENNDSGSSDDDIIHDQNTADDDDLDEYPVLERLPVLVTTNEKRPQELAKIHKLGWILLDHGDAEGDDEGQDANHAKETIKLGTQSALGPFWPPMLDAILLTRGDYFIGMKNSRMSELAALRGKNWYGHTTMLL
ncbi:hypothetical protein BGZ94_002479 [Podila epigama]|nr:hypothetical protein BGZ94_002479 [Podila epigama]